MQRRKTGSATRAVRTRWPGDALQLSSPPHRAQGNKSEREGLLGPPCLAVPPQGSQRGSRMGRGDYKGGFYELVYGNLPWTPGHWGGASTMLLHLLGDPLAYQEIIQHLNTLYMK